MKKVALVRPPMRIPRYAFSGLTVPPLGLAYVAAALRQKGHEVTLIDSVGEDIEQNIPYHADCVLHGLTTDQILERIPSDADFIGVSCMFSHEFPVYRDLMHAIKRRFSDVPVIAGGEHITALPEESFRQCSGIDIAVMGEGEETISDIVASGRSDEEFGSPSREFIGVTAMVNRALLQAARASPRRRFTPSVRPGVGFLLKNYWKYGMGLGVNRGRSMPMLATRGCPYQCTFCSNPVDVEYLIGRVANPRRCSLEMEHYLDKYHVENFDFYDLTAIVKKDWIIDFCRRILGEQEEVSITQFPIGVRFVSPSTREVARLLFASGCRNMTYAPESGSLEYAWPASKNAFHFKKGLEAYGSDATGRG